MSSLLFLSWISRKNIAQMRKNLGKLRGSFAAAKRPLAEAKVLTEVKVPHAAVRPRRKVSLALGSPPQRSSASPRRSHCSQHGNVVFLFRFFFFPLFRRLVY